MIIAQYSSQIILYTVQPFNNKTASETFLLKSGSVRSLDWIFITEASALQWLGEYVTLDKTFYNILFKREAVAVSVTSRFSSLSHSIRTPLLEI